MMDLDDLYDENAGKSSKTSLPQHNNRSSHPPNIPKDDSGDGYWSDLMEKKPKKIPHFQELQNIYNIEITSPEIGSVKHKYLVAGEDEDTWGDLVKTEN